MSASLADATRVCPDCPAVRQQVFTALVRERRPEGCVFRSTSLNARSPLPDRWGEEYALGLVRRGVVIRERADIRGNTVAIDAAGPGCMFPLQPSGVASSVLAGYAATDVRVCLLPHGVIEAVSEAEEEVALDVIRMQRQLIERVERLSEARSRPTAESRVASLLCTLADTLSPLRRQEHLPADLQQRDLAKLVGLRHETVCRVLTALAKENVTVRDRDGLHIVAPDRLAAR